MLSKAKIKYVRSLHLKKFRQKYQSYIAEGPKIVDELLKSSHQIHAIFATSTWIEANSSELNLNDIEIHEIAETELTKVSTHTNPQEVLAVAQFPEALHIELKQDALYLALDSISDPGNLGTIIRTADWFGVERIYCSEDCVDLFNPKVIQASMGSFCRIGLEYCSLESILVNPNITSYATTLDGKEISEKEKLDRGIIVIGNESKGIKQNLQSLCTKRIRIPSYGSAESLNAAIACGILLFRFRNG